MLCVMWVEWEWTKLTLLKTFNFLDKPLPMLNMKVLKLRNIHMCVKIFTQLL